MREKHFIALAGEAFHGPCGGSIDLLSASRSLEARGISQPSRGKHQRIAGRSSKYNFLFGCVCVVAFGFGFVLVVQIGFVKRRDCKHYPPDKGKRRREGVAELTIAVMTMTTVAATTRRTTTTTTTTTTMK